MPKKLIGSRFRATIADASCLFEVVATQGRGGYRCVVINEPFESEGQTYDSDFAGRVKLFTQAEVESGIRIAEFHRKNRETHDNYYASLVPGAIVHYYHGCKQFVRCEVVQLTEEQPMPYGPTLKAGDKMLRPLTLLGNWHDYDLTRNAYFPKLITEGEFFCPNVSCIAESPGFSTREPMDPSTLPECEFQRG